MVRAPRDIIELVYRANTDAIREKEDNHGRTALHFACVHGAPTDVIKFLIEENPDALGEEDAVGRTPLCDAPVAVVPFMLERQPDSIWNVVKEPYNSSMCEPAICLLFRRLSAAEFQGLLQLLTRRNLETLQKIDEAQKRTILHWACVCRASPDIIEVLVFETPKAIQQEDGLGDTPLHCCVRDAGRSAPNLATIHHLLSADPTIIAKANHKGKTPLSLLWDHLDQEDEDEEEQLQRWEEASLRDVAYLLLRARHYGTVTNPLPPVAPGGAPKEFRLLHAACASGCPEDLFELILSAHTEQAGDCDEEGNTALGLSLGRLATATCRNINSIAFEVVDHCKSILKVCPEAAYRVDPRGRLPLHLALEEGLGWDDWSSSIIRDLVQAAPNTVGERDQSSGLFPFQLAAVHASLGANGEFDASTVYELIKRSPDLVAAM
eukprot:CAMPEP_0197464422 /NCGR_PEP_ID=MMETSP1175-20131217/64015_1 /TAXON_ID=1003142 /ORGANISM="Triceratium dubium, Strain CCMP147" /LENGTH=435 /DNA_ID=CAMNT_0043000403 /DNA_START=622 /DNA_END=1929 /DNA_ORIENTATION=+